MNMVRILLSILIIFILVLCHNELLYSQNSMRKIWQVEGKEDEEWLGSWVAGLGDINGDGFADVAVCSPKLDKTFIYFGGANIDTIPDLILKGGLAVKGKGDVNGDGYVDVMTSDNTNVYLYLGGADMDSVADLIFHESGGEYFGWPIAFIPDFNGDGFTDILLADASYLNYTGKVYIYFGGSPMDNQADWTKRGEAERSGFDGDDVSSLGDLNGDGYSDVIIGSGWYPEGDYRGKVEIYFGGAAPDTIPDVSILGAHANDLFGSSVSGAGDFNGDGYCDIVVGACGRMGQGNYAHIYFGGASIDTIPDVVMVGNSFLDRNFGFRVACAGDVNGDGYDDIIIGDDDSYGGIGSVHLFLGGERINGRADLIIVGQAADEAFGESVDSAGDVNGDGYDDIIVGSYLHAWFGQHEIGAAAIFAGNGQLTSVNEMRASPAQTPESFILCQNHPNPFNNQTVIRYSLTSINPLLVHLRIYNPLGEEVRTLVNENQAGGNHEIIWDGRDDSGKEVSSGVYYYELRAGGLGQVKKMALVR